MTVMVLLLVALIFLGCLMDSLSMILLVIPFFWPVLVRAQRRPLPDGRRRGLRHVAPRT